MCIFYDEMPHIFFRHFRDVCELLLQKAKEMQWMIDLN